ncbi:Hypothetical protein POVN_LOCUS713, partial [uncultured virus]
VDRITDAPEPTEGYVVVNCLSWFKTNTLKLADTVVPLYEVSPYHLRDGQILFENLWQGAKLWPMVFRQEQPEKRGGWTHPEETHVTVGTDGQDVILPAYWAWRIKLAYHPNPVRYPNGYFGRHLCLCHIWSSDGKTIERLDYIQARERIYVKEYTRLVKQTKAFQLLQAYVKAGGKVELLDVDCPASIEVTADTFKSYLADTKLRFGHTWALAACLLGLSV